MTEELLQWTPTPMVAVVGDRVLIHGPPPLTWWDRFLWRFFRIERKRPYVVREFIVTATCDGETIVDAKETK